MQKRSHSLTEEESDHMKLSRVTPMWEEACVFVKLLTLASGISGYQRNTAVEII